MQNGALQNAGATAFGVNALTEAQAAHFWRDGFLVINDVFSPEEVARLREACESPAILDPGTRAGLEKGTVHLLGITAKHPAFLHLARDPRLVAMLKTLLGDDIQLQHSKLAAQAKIRGKGGFSWHQDFAFFPHTNTSLLAIMVMIDDATPENGCMSMVRGSHRLGLLNHLNQDGYFTAMCREPEHWEAHPENVVPVTPRAGGISIHHCLTLHGSGPNPSGQPRRGIVFQYRADDAHQLADQVFPDTGLLISGQRRYQVRCEAQTWPLPRSPRPQSQCGSAWNQQGEFAQTLNDADARD